MSLDYAAGLSDYDDLGVCGLDEVCEKLDCVKDKIKILADWLRQMNGSCVIHVGAGLSTSAGIPDFRGKNGVWTKKLLNNGHSVVTSYNDLKREQDEPEACSMKPFDETEPTIGHLVLKELCHQGYVKHIISQNVDGLFLKVGLDRKFISELHGNFYLDECTKCRSRFIRHTAAKTMCLQKSNVKCPKESLKPCPGHLRDTILDWESPIPYNELRIARKESKKCKLHICVGTSLQLRPSKDLVCDPSRDKASKLVIINLQPIKLDEKANLKINYYADNVFKLLANELNINVPTYNPDQDPTKKTEMKCKEWIKEINL